MCRSHRGWREFHHTSLPEQQQTIANLSWFVLGFASVAWQSRDKHECREYLNGCGGYQKGADEGAASGLQKKEEGRWATPIFIAGGLAY